MKIALPMTLALGALSILAALFSAFLFYVVYLDSPTLFTGPIANSGLAAAVASAPDIATLKLACQAMANSLEKANSLSQTQTLMLGEMLRWVLWLTLGAGLIFGAAFLYLHLLLRQIVRVDAARQA